MGGLNIYQHSSNSANVYVRGVGPVTVNIAECPSAGCATVDPATAPIVASITFNSPDSQPTGSTNTFAYTPSTVTVSGRNVSGRNSAIYVSGRNVSGRNVSGRNAALYDPATNTTLPVFKVDDYSLQVTPTSDDDVGSYLSMFNVDEAYGDDYVFQVLVTKPLTSFTAAPGCEPFNSTDGALVGQATVSGRNVSGRNVSGRNVSGRNPVPIDGDFAARTLQNTSFTMGSSTADYLGAGSGSGSQTNFGCSPTNGAGRIGECTLAAPRLPNTVTVTLRAYQVTASPARVYDPVVTPPAITVAEYSCKTADCLQTFGPDLSVPTASGVSPTDVPAGAVVTFPTASVTVTNVGKDCSNGDRCGTAQANRWGIYLSTATKAADLPRYTATDQCAKTTPRQCVPGTIKQNLTDFTQPVTTLLSLANGQTATGALQQLVVDPARDSSGNLIPCGDSGASCAYVASQSVQIPSTIPRRNADGTGTYYAYLYIDDQRVVSELNEDNNIVQGGPITVRAAGFGFLGLQTPCSGFTCDKTGTMPLAWQFTNGSRVEDTATNLPRLKFWPGCPYTNVDASGYPNTAQIASSAPNAADLTSGGSGWQYFPNPGMSRPQFSWQFNFDATGLPRGSCYTMWVEIPSTGQVVKPTDPNIKPFGPFSITPR